MAGLAIVFLVGAGATVGALAWMQQRVSATATAPEAPVEGTSSVAMSAERATPTALETKPAKESEVVARTPASLPVAPPASSLGAQAPPGATVDSVPVVRWSRIVSNILPTADFLRELANDVTTTLPR